MLSPKLRGPNDGYGYGYGPNDGCIEDETKYKFG